MPHNDEHKSTSGRGFASMDQAKQRQIASKGGQSVPAEKRSFSQDPGLAAQAGRKGGESVPPEGRSFSQNRELAAEAGRKGGQARGASSRRAKALAAKTGLPGLPGRNESGRTVEESHQATTQGVGQGAARHQQKPSREKERAHENQDSAEAAEEFEHAEDLESRGGFGSQDVEEGDTGQGPGRPGSQPGKEHSRSR